MQGCRIEVGAVRPNERVYLWIDPNLIEYGQIAERSEQFSGQGRLEINQLFRVVFESHAEREWCDYLERLHTVYIMHDLLLHLSGSIGNVGWPLCNLAQSIKTSCW